MNFIQNPNLPEMPVSVVVADKRLSIEIAQWLQQSGIRVIMAGRHEKLYSAVESHPDMLIHHVGGNTVVYAPGTSAALLEELSALGFRLVTGASELSWEYPADIAYNAARVGKFLFHNIKYTDPVLLAESVNLGIEPVDVKQGYAKCSVSVVDESSIITSDKGIAKAAEKRGLDVLLIDSRQKISLPGLDYGFIGGSTLLLDKYSWGVCGNAEQLPAFEQLNRFLASKKIKIISLSSAKAQDYGSILPLLTI